MISPPPFLLLAVLAGVATEGPETSRAPDAVPTAEELVERVAAMWDLPDLELTSKMTIVRADGTGSEADLLIRRAGAGRTRVDFLSPPKDRGKVILHVGNESWLYLPRTGRTVAIPAKRNPMTGAVLFEDLLPGRPELADARVEEEPDGFVLVVAGSGKSKRKSRTSRIYFSRSTLLPFRREIHASSGRLLQTVHIDETRAWRGAEIPWDVRFVNNIRGATEVHLEVIRVDGLAGDPEELFSRERIVPLAGEAATDEP